MMIADFDTTIPQETGERIWSKIWPEFPYRSVRIRYLQWAPNYVPSTLGTPWGENAAFFLVQEDAPSDVGGGFVEFARVYEEVPIKVDLVRWGNTTVTFPGFFSNMLWVLQALGYWIWFNGFGGASASNNGGSGWRAVYRRPRTLNVRTKIITNYFNQSEPPLNEGLIGDPSLGYIKEKFLMDDPVCQGVTIASVGGIQMNPPIVYNSTVPDYISYINAMGKWILVEDIEISQYKGVPNLFQLTGRFVMAQ